jgi:predicted RNase H-like HicB family nuclease
MRVKVAYDFEDNEYIAFVDKIPNISGFGPSEKDAILNLLYQAKEEDGFNKEVIIQLIEKMENEN